MGRTGAGPAVLRTSIPGHERQALMVKKGSLPWFATKYMNVL